MNCNIPGLAFLGLGALILATDHAIAQQNRNCAARAVVVEKLTAQYGETRHAMGLGADNQVIEVFASAATGTWTILVSTAAGRSCVVAAGQAFETTDERLPPAGKPA